MVTYLDASGIKKLSANKKLQDHAYRAWFSGLVCSAVAGVYSLWRLRERERSLDRKIGEGAAEAKMIERYILPTTLFYSIIQINFSLLQRTLRCQDPTRLRYL